ncbi:hypothetical protein GEV33_003737 [Tenebrio molitor]|uniref:Uncharacterized protein n=1 Tax=Tenebrio molitor TaxID=7067 RepID=A0A8J6LE06_TENMO|nr:hypothetical protein GEV33_003737 [Tenebrio molitor]
MEQWLKISLTLSLIGFLKEFRPSEAFYYEYFVGSKNFTEDQVNREALPTSIYSTLVLQVFAFLITDMCRYKPLIIVLGLSGVIMYSLMLWTTSLLGLQIALGFNGLFYGTEVAYYTYIYGKVDKEHFERVTSHTNAAILAGRTSSGILAQVLVSVKWMDVEQLNYISLGAMVLTTLWACLLPSVKESIYFQSEEVGLLPFSKKVMSAFVVIKGHFTQAFTNPRVVKWGMWHGFTIAGYTAMEYYIQALYSLLQTEDQDLFNGAVIAVQTFLGFCASLLAGYAVREKLMADQDFVAVKDKCLTILGLTEDELKFDVDTSDVSENVLCFFKCIQQERGVIDEAGSLHSEKIFSSPHFTALTENEQNEVKKCVEGVDKIETCQDIAPLVECLHNSL